MSSFSKSSYLYQIIVLFNLNNHSLVQTQNESIEIINHKSNSNVLSTTSYYNRSVTNSHKWSFSFKTFYPIITKIVSKLYCFTNLLVGTTGYYIMKFWVNNHLAFRHPTFIDSLTQFFAYILWGIPLIPLEHNF
jgi:hypothetical protein